MTRIRSLLVCVICIAVLGVSATAAQAACSGKTWVGGSGNWEEASHWSPSGAPGSSESACITASGTYTVTVSADALAKTLTVGGASGVQTIDVVGASQSIAGDTYDETTLGAETMSFAANSKLILDATPGGSAQPKGGGGVVNAYTVTEAGQIETTSSEPRMDDRIKVSNLRIEPSASLLDASGTLLFIKEGEGAYPWATTNEGTFTVAPGATVEMQPSFSGKAGFINAGSVVNEGSIITHGAEWQQQAGSESGNPVALQSSSTLIDSAGTGSFLGNYDACPHRHHPRGPDRDRARRAVQHRWRDLLQHRTQQRRQRTRQRRHARAQPHRQRRNRRQRQRRTGLHPQQRHDRRRNGNRVEGHPDPGGHHQRTVGAARDQRRDLPGQQRSSAHQRRARHRRARRRVPAAGGATFLNHGTFSPEIASATSFGAVQLFSPCCNGPGVFTAGGTLAPVLVGGFTPATGQEFNVFKLEGGKFEGTFPSVANGFTGDYSHESSETAFVGVIYGGSTSGGGGAGGGGGGSVTAPPVAIVSSISGKRGKITAKLSCPSGGAACSPATLKATVVEHLSKHGRILRSTAGKKPKTKTVTIAVASATIAAGATRTITLRLNATGRALLARYGKLSVLVTVRSGGKTLRLIVRVVEAPKAKKG